MTIIITVLAAAFMLSGTGSAIIDAHDSFSKTDQLAAISLILSGVPDGALPVTLLDVDDATRKTWKSPVSTPHAALAELIRIAAGGGAKGVLLDFDLTMDTDTASADPALLAILKDYPADAPMLMLVRKIGFAKSLAAPDRPAVFDALATPSPYDSATSAKPNVVWVTTLNDIGSDRAVRRIRMWQAVCEGASGIAYPSAALVTAGVLAADGTHRDDMKSFLDARVSEQCGNQAGPHLAWPPMQAQSAQLPYVFSDDAASPALFKVEANGRQMVVLRRISAAKLVSYSAGRATAAGEIDRDPFDGRVVIIGGTYTESPDVHQTPLGTMPGSIILANSIVQAPALASTVPAAGFVRNALALAVFIIFAVFMRYFVGVVALIGIGVISVIALVSISRLFGFESGFETVAAAITGFALFKLIDALANIALDIPKRGWRAIMKS